MRCQPVELYDSCLYFYKLAIINHTLYNFGPRSHSCFKLTVDEVKAIAIVSVLLFEELNLSSIILEGDSKVVIEALRSGDEPLDSFVHLIIYAKSYAYTFSSISFSHTRRQDNSITPNLNRHAKHVSNLSMCMEDVSSHLNDVILVDYG